MVSAREVGAVVGVAGLGLYEFFRLPEQVRAQLCCALPILAVVGIGLFAFGVKETLRVSRGG